MPAMTLTYGSYTHPDVLIVTPDETVVRSQDGTALYKSVVYEVSGKLWAANSSALDTKIDALIAAYAVDGKDFSLAYPGGGDTEIALDNSDALGGIRVLRRPRVTGSGGSGTYVVVWPYSLALEANVELYDGDTLVEFQESVEYAYGGPQLMAQETLTTAAVVYQTREKSAYRYRQSGRIVGWQSYPTVPAPLNATYENQAARAVVHEAPAQIGTARRMYPISYSYEFVSPSALSGMTPNTFASALAQQD